MCPRVWGKSNKEQTCRESVAALKLSRHVARSCLMDKQKERFFQGGTQVLALENENEAYPRFI